jgi:RimJ/RimL family protein N-acetyltransferase
MQREIAPGICLTEFNRSDAESLVGFLNDRDIYDRTLRIPYPYTVLDADEWLGVVEKLSAENCQPLHWAIRQKGQVIGGIGFDGFAIGQSHRAEIGYWLAKQCWGQGIMTAAVQSVCLHAFENLGVVRLQAHVFSFNRASGRVLEKCGFKWEGYLRNHFLKDGNYIDARLYGLVHQ